MRFLIPAAVVSLLALQSLALQSVPGSNCSQICSSPAIGSLQEDVVCLDSEFSTTKAGRDFKRCIACQLNSTAVDERNNVTDVDWAFFNMRFTLSVCMFGFPEEKVGISSPCQVTCQPLSTAIGHALSNDTSKVTPGLAYCNAGQFDDTTINNCAFCYGFIPQQLFMANFLQTLHIACRQPPQPGQEFYPKAYTIFNLSVIAGPTGAPSPKPSSGLHSWKLALAIVLPLVAFGVLSALSCFGCYAFTRHRRQTMAASGRMERMHHSMAVARDPMFANVDPYIQRYSDYEDRYGPEMSGVMPRHSPARPETSPIRDDVGPGEDQLQDHELHNQYFGTPTVSGVGEAIPMTAIGTEAQSSNEISPVSATSRRSQAGPSYAARISLQQQREGVGGYRDA